jgi:hypothetical protein
MKKKKQDDGPPPRSDQTNRIEREGDIKRYRERERDRRRALEEYDHCFSLDRLCMGSELLTVQSTKKRKRKSTCPTKAIQLLLLLHTRGERLLIE